MRGAARQMFGRNPSDGLTIDFEDTKVKRKDSLRFDREGCQNFVIEKICELSTGC